MRESIERGGITARAVENRTANAAKQERRRLRRRNRRIHSLIVGAIGLFIAVISVMTVSYNVKMTQLKGEVEEKTAILEQLESEYVSLNARQANNLDLDEIEEYAKNVLGLVKMDRSQEEYLELQKTDQVEVNEASSGVDKLVSSFVKSFNAILSFLR